MTRTSLVNFAVREARSIRRQLIAEHGAGYGDGQGWCAIASLMLANRLGSTRSLRFVDDHVWNQVQDTIIDITASQFDEAITDVYVVTAPSPQSFHAGAADVLRGAAVIDLIDTWYTVVDDDVVVGGGDAAAWWQARLAIPPQARRWCATPHETVLSAAGRRVLRALAAEAGRS